MTDPEVVSLPRLYLVGARSLFESDRDWLEALTRVALAAGHFEASGLAIQVRIEDTFREAAASLAAQALRCLRDVDPERHIPLYLNAPGVEFEASGFDAIHWPERRIPAFKDPALRARCGASAHSLQALQRAEAGGADFVLLGPVWAPSWKPSRTLGIEALQALTRRAHLPILALGGITPERVGACLAAGAYGIAVASGVFKAADTEEALRSYSQPLAPTST